MSADLHHRKPDLERVIPLCVDVEQLLRDRADGTLDIVKLTDAEAVALGLQKPSIAMRIRSLWTRFNRWAR